MVQTNINQQTNYRRITERHGCFALLERTVPSNVNNATSNYFAEQAGVRKRQIIVNLKGNNGVLLQAGAMQWIAGDVQVSSNIKGAGDFAKKLIGGKVTGESAVKPHYTGKGTLVLEPTHKHLLFEDISAWESGMVIDDGLFYVCEDTVELKVIARNTISSAALGGEGLFNTCLSGKGIAVLESPLPREELIVMELTEPDDVVKIDGNMAIAWSNSLRFTVEKTTKTLMGSAATGEGFVNVYRGVGKILMIP